MPSIIWTRQALEDLNARFEFLRLKDEVTARQMAKTVLEQVKKLEAFPQIGRPSLDLEPEHRELLIAFGVSGYILLYEQLEDRLLILAFRHQKEVGYAQ